MTFEQDELSRLEDISESHDYKLGFNGILMEYKFKAVAHHIMPSSSVLEMGPADGLITGKILSITENLTVLDGSIHYLADIEKNHPEVTTIHGLFEEVDLNTRFDVILMVHILEHVEDPVRTLTRVREWLKDDGKVIITVPNAHSYHRMLGVEMDLLESEFELNESDLMVGHRRVYDSDSLANDVQSAGLSISESTGVFFKLFHNSLMETFSESQLEGLYHLGKKFPDNCAELLIVATI